MAPRALAPLLAVVAGGTLLSTGYYLGLAAAAGGGGVSPGGSALSLAARGLSVSRRWEALVQQQGGSGGSGGAISGGGGGGGKSCVDPHPVDVPAATAALRAATWPPVAYDNTTVCEDLGPACLGAGGTVLLYGDAWQPAGGRYVAPPTAVAAALARMSYHVFWEGGGGGGGSVSSGNGSAAVAASVGGGGNADQFLGTMRPYERGVGWRLVPAGAGAAPPHPFASHCAAPPPLLLFWDFPENFFHGMATLTALWAAVDAGAVDAGRVSVGLGLPFAAGRGVPQWMAQPLEALLRGELGARGRVGQPAPPPPPPLPAPPRVIATIANFAAAVSAGGGGDAARDEVGPTGVRTAREPMVCYASVPACAVASFLARAVPGMYDFMARLKVALLPGLRLPPPPPPGQAPPEPPPYVTGADGALRVTLAVRSEGTRRVLNLDELLQGCANAAPLELGGGGGGGGAAALRVVCRVHAFGQDAGGMAADAAAMHETDVLVGVHGAGLTNLGFLRPGAVVVELRPSKFRASNGDRFYRPMARDSGVLKWWAIVMFRTYERPGALEAAGLGNRDQWPRDRDVTLPWRALEAALRRLLPMRLDEWLALDASNRAFSEVAPGENGN